MGIVVPQGYRGKLPGSVLQPWGPCLVYGWIFLPVENTGLERN